MTGQGPFPRLLGGRFLLDELIGRGGMGAVYRALDQEAGRQVAVKVLAQTTSESALARFQREGELTARLTHPGIVRVFSAGETNGYPYLVYELVEGRVLDQVSDLTLSQRLELLAQVADALGFAHEQGIVHRDVKPGNAILEDSGRVRVFDFGVAWAANQEALTQTGTMIGTPSYMAPEAMGGRPTTATADVWSLGVWLYEWLAHVLPFPGESLLELAAQVCSGQYRRLPPGVPPGAQAVVDRCLSLDPEARYANAGELASAIRAIGAASSISRGRTILVFSILGVAILGGVAPFWGLRLGRPARESPVGLGPDVTTTPSAAGTLSVRHLRVARELLDGGEVTSAHRALAGGKSAEAHALGAVLAAMDGNSEELERRLLLHGFPRRRELDLLPLLLVARSGQLTKTQAEKVLHSFPGGDPDSLFELEGLRQAARIQLGRTPARDLLGEPPGHYPAWTRDLALGFLTESRLGVVELTEVTNFGGEAGPVLRARLAKRIRLVISSNVRSGAGGFTEEKARLLTEAVRAFRAVSPPSGPLPAEAELVDLSFLVAFDGSTSSESTVDLCIALAEALPDNERAQSGAARMLWNKRASGPTRWRAFLGITRRELALTSADGSRTSERRRILCLNRLWKILVSLQEALPFKSRDHAELEEALETLDRVALSAPPGSPRGPYPANRAYVRWLLGKVSPADRALIDTDTSLGRIRVAQLYLATDKDMADLALRSIPHIVGLEREVIPGILAHRVGQDVLWPREGVRSSTASVRKSLLRQLAVALEPRNRALSLYWRVSIARLAATPQEQQRELALAAQFADQSGWREFASRVRGISTPPATGALVELANRAAKLQEH